MYAIQCKFFILSSKLRVSIKKKINLLEAVFSSLCRIYGASQVTCHIHVHVHLSFPFITFFSFWSLLAPFCQVYKLQGLPLVSSFGRGFGGVVAVDGKVHSTCTCKLMYISYCILYQYVYTSVYVFRLCSMEHGIT